MAGYPLTATMAPKTAMIAWATAAQTCHAAMVSSTTVTAMIPRLTMHSKAWRLRSLVTL